MHLLATKSLYEGRHMRLLTRIQPRKNARLQKSAEIWAMQGA